MRNSRSLRNSFSATFSCRLAFVAQTMRVVTLISSVPPRRRNWRLSRKLSNFDWSGSDIESISSRKSVPPSATSSRPGLAARASVKAPFS